MTKEFSIREDLETRDLSQQIEIMFISGPRSHDPKWIAERLNITVDRVMAEVERIVKNSPYQRKMWEKYGAK